MAVARTRMWCFMAGLFAVGAVAAARLVWLQGFHHDYYEKMARSQVEERIEVDLPRATLTDRNGLVLAASVRTPSLYTFSPKKLRAPVPLARAISKLSGESTHETLEKMKGRNTFTWLARKLPFRDMDAAKVICTKFKGCSMMDEWGRDYPNGTLAANLIGCMGVDKGLSGLESQWNDQLKGGKRHYIVMRDAVSTTLIPLDLVSDVDPEPPTIKLTLDGPIQYQAEQVLGETVRKYGARDGVAIVLDPNNGDILAMAVRPTFDPNRPLAYPPADWRNHAVLDAYEPGSTFKIVTLAAALETGLYQPGQEVDVGNGTLWVGNTRIHDDEPPKAPEYNLGQILAYSSNVGAAKIGMALGPETLYHYIRLFGFDQVTSLHLRGETPGFLRPPSEWTSLSLPALSFGQELRVTPLQLSLAYACLAEGGMKVNPRIILDGAVPPARRIISARTADILTRMLELVVKEGTGTGAAIPGFTVAGKTGTAQKMGIKTHGTHKPFIAYFVGFAPATRPAVVTLVMVDEPSTKIYGGQIAAPAFSKITAFALKRLGVAPAANPVPRLDMAKLEGTP